MLRIFSIVSHGRDALIPLSILFLFSCTNSIKDRDKDGLADNKDKCPEVFAKTAEGCPPEREISGINLYAENSASMAGYFRKDAEFKTIISDLAVKADKNIAPVKIRFIADTVKEFQGSVQQFTSDIAITNFATSKSSQLHKIISNIASVGDSNSVAILVSDCILSFPDADIRKNPEINSQEAPNALKNNIYSTFADLKKKGYAASIYLFNSKFYGTYYDYTNNIKAVGSHVLNGNSRPFYIWVIADKAILSKFNNKLKDITTFNPAHTLHFGFTDEPVTSYNIISQAERKGSWMWDKSDQAIEDIDPPSDGPMQFCVAMDLAKLPSYAQDMKYLQDNLQVEAKGCNASFQVKDKRTIDRSKIKSKAQVESFENATHFIVFSIDSMNLPLVPLRVALPLKYDTWYIDRSTMDDRNLAAAGNKTFALEHLINGVREAYETRNNNFIDFTITLKK
jgi:hypothetical protein